ncbi:hypothetical protein Hanom_Chr14g01266871 [Helianthus anomalus]
MWIRSTVMNRVIILSEETLGVALQLNDDIDATFFTRETLDEILKEMGYHTPNRSRKHGHFNELSYRLMEVVHAVVQDKPYNFFKFLMRDLEANMRTHQAFLIYPRFVMKVITSQLGFGGVTNWYQRAQLALLENLNVPSLVPTNQHTGHITYMWVYATLVYDD